MPDITRLVTTNYRVLEHLCTLIGPDRKVSTTQQEIADKLGLSRATVNRIISELKEDGYIEQDGNHVGRYVIHKTSSQIVKLISNTNGKMEA